MFLLRAARSSPRRGWSSVATPSGWYEVIRGPRPLSVQWPHAPKGKGKGKAMRNQWQFPEHRRSLRDSRRCEVSVGDGPQDGEGRGAQVGPSRPKVCRSISTRQETRSGVVSVGRGRPRCRNVKSCFEAGKDSRSSAPGGLCLQHIARVKKQVARAQEQVRAAQEVQQQMEEKLANGLRDLETACRSIKTSYSTSRATQEM